MKGYQASKNSMGLWAVKLHYSADPEHDPTNPDPVVAESAQQWVDGQKMSYPDPNDWAREMEISFSAAQGTRVFPQYSPIYHERPLEKLRHKVVSRGWDFGWHAPVCLFSQIDAQGRLLILREIVGAKTTTREFAQDVLKAFAEHFPLHTPGAEDFVDPAGAQTKSIESEKSERRDIDILEGLGIHPKYEWGWSRKDGRSLIHQLLTLRTDGTPSVYVDPMRCPILSEGFSGRYIYPETLQGKIREDPNDEEHPFGDVMAALRYLVTGLHQRLSLTRFKASQLAHAAPRTSTGYGIRR